MLGIANAVIKDEEIWFIDNRMIYANNEHPYSVIDVENSALVFRNMGVLDHVEEIRTRADNRIISYIGNTEFGWISEYFSSVMNLSDSGPIIIPLKHLYPLDIIIRKSLRMYISPAPHHPNDIKIVIRPFYCFNNYRLILNNPNIEEYLTKVRSRRAKTRLEMNPRVYSTENKSYPNLYLQKLYC